jgi:integrase
MVHLAVFCGLRYGEIVGLTCSAIDFHRRVIKVRNSLTAWDELKEPKTRSGLRDVPMPSHLWKLLEDWLSRFYIPNDRILVFRRKSGGTIASRHFFTCHWRPLLARSGLHSESDNFHFHALRHFAAS